MGAIVLTGQRRLSGANSVIARCALRPDDLELRRAVPLFGETQLRGVVPKQVVRARPVRVALGVLFPSSSAANVRPHTNLDAGMVLAFGTGGAISSMQR